MIYKGIAWGFNPHHIAGLYNHSPFWSNLSDFDLLFRLWVSAERKFSLNHSDVCLKSEWACLWLEFLSYPGMASKGWMEVSNRRGMRLTLVRCPLLTMFNQKHGRLCEMFNYGFNHSSKACPIDMCTFYCAFTSSMRCPGLNTQELLWNFSNGEISSNFAKQDNFEPLTAQPFSKRLVLCLRKIRHRLCRELIRENWYKISILSMLDIITITHFSKFFLRCEGEHVHAFYQPKFANGDPEVQETRTM